MHRLTFSSYPCPLCPWTTPHRKCCWCKRGGLSLFSSTQSHNYKKRQSHYWEIPQTLFSDIHLIKKGLEQNIIMTIQHKNQTFHYSGNFLSSFTQVNPVQVK